MKRKLYFFLLIAGLSAGISACASMQGKSTNYRMMMVGDWILEDIEFDGPQGNFKTTLFNEAGLDCFMDSYWTLTRPNSLGTYTLGAGGDCPQGLERNFRWTIHKTEDGLQQFQFKRLDGNMDPMDDNTGFRLDILDITEDTMTLRDEVMFNNQPVYLTYSFSRR